MGGLVFGLPFIERHHSFALAADVEEDIVSFAAEHDPGQNVARFERLRCFFIQGVDAARLFGFDGQRRKRRLQLVVVDAEFTDKIAVHHTRSLPVAEKSYVASGEEPDGFQLPPACRATKYSRKAAGCSRTRPPSRSERQIRFVPKTTPRCLRAPRSTHWSPGD